MSRRTIMLLVSLVYQHVGGDALAESCLVWHRSAEHGRVNHSTQDHCSHRRKLSQGLLTGAAKAVYATGRSPAAACEEDACAGVGCFLGRSCSLKSTSMLRNRRTARESPIVAMLKHLTAGHRGPQHHHSCRFSHSDCHIHGVQCEEERRISAVAPLLGLGTC